MSINNQLFQQGPKFSLEEGKQIQYYYWKDKKFRNKFNGIRNAWLFQKVSVATAVDLIKDEIKKAEKRNNN